jgi:hypothetical protein
VNHADQDFRPTRKNVEFSFESIGRDQLGMADVPHDTPEDAATERSESASTNHRPRQEGERLGSRRREQAVSSMGRRSQCRDEHDSRDPLRIPCCRELRDSTTMTVTDEVKGLAPRKRLRHRNGVLGESLEMQRFGTGAWPSTSTETGHVDRHDVGDAEQQRPEAFPIEQRTRVPVKEQTFGPRGVS